MTIDGPSGSGKGTVCRAAARELGWALLDSGALYRLVALAARRTGVSLEDGARLGDLARAFDIRFGSDEAGDELVWLDGRDVTRYKQLKEKGVAATLAALSREIAERDQRDITRSASPLVASDDAVLLDTTGMPVDAVIRRVLEIARERLAAG
jgi:cytidylate kinase